jgi:hypothetical protein
MSKIQIGAIFELIERLNDMKARGAPEEEIEKLADDIGDLQMNVVIGELEDES